MKRIGKDVIIYASADLIARGTQLLALPIYTQFLSVAEFGKLALLTVSASLLSMLLNLGVNNAVQRFYFDSESAESQRPVIVSTGLAGLIASGILCSIVAAAIIAMFGYKGVSYSGIGMDLFIMSIANVLPEQITQYSQDVIRLHFKPVRFFIVALVRTFLGVVIGIVLLSRFGMGIHGVLLGTLIGSIMAVPLGLLAIKDDLVFRFDPKVARKLFQYGSPFVLVGASYWIFQSMDRWMLLNLGDINQVGVFSIANKFAVIVSFATFAFNRAWSPYAFYIYANNPDYKIIYARIFSVWFFVIAFIGLGISLFSMEILRIMTPQEYWGAAPILSIMCAAMAIDGTTIITLLGITLERRTFLMNYGTWLAAGANLALNFLLIPRLGAIGAAVAAFTAYGVLTTYFLWMSQRLHPISFEWGKLAYPLALIVLTIGAPFVLVGHEIGVTALVMKCVFLVVILGGAGSFKIITFDEIRNMIRS
jgi:O-antigen/teichoic acid export membrane protein